MWFTYVLECSDGSYYTGMTADLDARVERHNKGKGSEYTRYRRPVKLVYREEFSSKKEAEVREIEIKKLGRKNKECLITSIRTEQVSLATGNE